jgi:hypothetical protein
MRWYEDAGWLVVALLITTWLISVIVRGIARRWRLHRHHRRQRVAIRGERDAERLLERDGYVVIDRQVQGAWLVFLDDQPIDVELVADLLVERDGERFVAEVKTGTKAPRIQTARTRRQLLEYAHAFDVDGVILVDMAAMVAHRVHFGTAD